MKANNIFQKYGYAWITLILFFGSLIGHWLFAWPVFVQEQLEHGQEVQFKDFFMQTSRDTLENWQSEFLQLIWQVVGLAYLLYLGSPQSKEGDDRIEEKIDSLLTLVDKEKGEAIIKSLDKKYLRQ